MGLFDVRVAVADGDPDLTALIELTRSESPGLTFRVFEGQPRDTTEWLERIDGSEVLLLNWSVPDDVLTNAPGLRAVAFLGTGASDNVNLPLADDLGIEVLTVRDYGTQAVAQHAVALILAGLHDVAPLDRAIRSNQWRQPERSEWRDVHVGIIGMGSIGRNVEQICRSLGFQTNWWNRRQINDAPGKPSDLSTIFQTCDVISLHLALTPETEGLIGRSEFAAMRTGSLLVNTARAGLVVDEALFDAVSSGRIRVAQDVFDVEPLPGSSRLLQLDGATLSPHVGFNSTNANRRLVVGALHQITTWAQQEADRRP